MSSVSTTYSRVVIEPHAGFSLFWRDAWHYRELFLFLAWRELAVRYKQTAIGVAWSVIQPFLTMVIFTVVFNRLVHLHSSVPYPILVFSGLLPWTFFSNAVTQSSASLIANANMVSKVYFPRIALPTAMVVVAFADFLIALGILAALMVFFQFAPGIQIFTMPLFLLLAIMFSLGCGYWLSSLNVKYRDFRYIVPFMLQLGLYISPIGFSSSVVGGRWHTLFSFNPMVGIIDGFRWSILGAHAPLDWLALSLSIVISSVVLISGIWFFFRTEQSFADVI